MKVSIIIPVFNEQETVVPIINQVLQCSLPLDKEVIVINDCSTDLTLERIKSINNPGIVLIDQGKNMGKGAAVRAGIERATGDYILIQDADFEYSPNDYPAMLKPLIDGDADAVYGTRLKPGEGSHRVMFFRHYLTNKCLTLLSNIFTNLNLTDMEVGLKAFMSDIIKRIPLKENRFGIEPEITAKIAKLKYRIYEVPISYYGRTHKEGKKIRWEDGISALRCIIQYSLFK
ncbi:MAG: glycosyltransferase family 2 protein [Elusimicrobiota bacterium]